MSRPSTDTEDEAFCDHCDKETLHVLHDDGHERDSSGDYRLCKVCRWGYFGIFGTYEPMWAEDGSEVKP